MKTDEEFQVGVLMHEICSAIASLEQLTRGEKLRVSDKEELEIASVSLLQVIMRTQG